MLEAGLEADDELEQGFRAGPGARVGLLVDFMPGWRMALLASSINYSEGQRGEVGRAELRQRFSITANVEVNLDLLWLEDYRQGRLGLGWYF